MPVWRTDPFGFFQGGQTSGTVHQQVGGGTGLFVNAKGLILTNKHVVGDPQSSYTVVLSDGREFTGSVVAVDPVTDLAIVQASTPDGKPLEGTRPATFVNDPSTVTIGSFAVAIGNALAQFQNTITFGIVSGLGRTIQASGEQGTNELSGLIQTDTPISPGNSGGPLVDLDGHVIGINTAIATQGNGLGFSIPVSAREISYIIRSVEQYHAIKRPFIGVYYTPLMPDQLRQAGVTADAGYQISNPDGSTTPPIIAGSPAAIAGLAAGDIILGIDGTSVRPDGSTLRNILKWKEPGEMITLRVWHPATKKESNVTITLGSVG